MKVLFIFWGLFMIFNAAPFPLHAEIYSWTDENGVRRFSHQPPDKPASEVKTTDEIPYDEEAAARVREREKIEAEEARRLETEKALKEVERTKQKLEEAEKRIDELDKEVGDLKTENEYDERRYYHNYLPSRPCWPNCGYYPPQPPDVKPPPAKPTPLKKPRSYWRP